MQAAVCTAFKSRALGQLKVREPSVDEAVAVANGQHPRAASLADAAPVSTMTSEGPRAPSDVTARFDCAADCSPKTTGRTRPAAAETVGQEKSDLAEAPPKAPRLTFEADLRNQAKERRLREARQAAILADQTGMAAIRDLIENAEAAARAERHNQLTSTEPSSAMHDRSG